MGQDEDPQPLVRRPDLCRREQARRRRVAHCPKLSEDGFGAAFANDAGDFGPEVAGIVGAATFASGAERLARVACEDRVESPAEGSGVEAAQIGPDRCRGEVIGRLRCDEDSARPVLPFDEGAGVIARFCEHEAQIKASAACAEGQSVPGT